MKFKLIISSAIAAWTVLIFTTQNFAQDAPLLIPAFAVKPWTGGTPDDAFAQSAAATTIPLSRYSIPSTKDKGEPFSVPFLGSALSPPGSTPTRIGTIVGTSPFATPISGSTIYADVVPLIIHIPIPEAAAGASTTVFDPTAPNSCDGGVSALQRFQASPLVQNVPGLTFNGVNVGNVQFADGFRRAEFWAQTGGNPAYSNPVRFIVTAPAEVTVPAALAHTYSSGCRLLGEVNLVWLDLYLNQTLMPQLTRAGLLSTSKFVIFLTKNVVMTEGGCCILGYHSAIGRPVQTYSVIDWDITGLFGLSVADASVASHEIAEWMDDPLGLNLTLPWGKVGQVPGCQRNLEVGDPLSGTLMPSIAMNGYTYHLQELAFFSWFFNSRYVPSLGAGGKFSSNGTFTGPSKVCPAGGTF